MRALPLAGLLLLVTLAGAVLASDDGETLVMVKDTIEQIERAHKSRDRDLLETAFVRLVELHNGLEGEDWRKKLQAAAGDLLRDKKCPELYDAVVSTLEQLDDGDGVYEQLKRLLPKTKDPEVSDLQAYAVRVVGELKSEAGLKTLLDLAAKGESLKGRAAAIQTLGNYRTVKKKRVAVLKVLLQTLSDVHPGDEPDDAALETWSALEQPLVKALDNLTFQDLDSSRKWLEWYTENKSKPEVVFDKAGD